MSTIRYLTALLAASLVAQATPGLRVSIGGDSSFTGVDAFTVHTVVQNVGDEPLELFNEPQGVLNPIPTRSFKFARSGSDAPQFVGPIVKYSFKHATSFTTLQPGDSVTVDHNLGNAYAFSNEGSYSISPLTRFYYRNQTDGTPIPIDADFDRPHTAKLRGSLISRYHEKRKEHWETLQKRSELQSRSVEKRQTQFANCTSDQQSQIQLSTYVASLYVANAEKYLTLQQGQTDRWAEWFGTYSPEHHATILEHFMNIRTSDVKTYTFDCGCEEGDDIYAYVFPNQFGHVYLCHQYMIAELQGTDSKGGTIVHESTHFTRNAGTDDVSYGQSGARQLAITNSSLAITNADSHEYFAENNPWQA